MTSSDGFVPNPDAAELAAVNRQIAETMQYPDVTTSEGLGAIRGNVYALSVELSQSVSERTIPGPGGDLRLWIIRPEGPVKAVMIDIHGGGWCLGTPQDDDWINDYYADHSQIASVSIDYRLAPEYPFPPRSTTAWQEPCGSPRTPQPSSAPTGSCCMVPRPADTSRP